MRLPRRTPVTIDVKSSSVMTTAAASRATSVPRPPMATPMLAALSAGASLTPSPVMATTCPSAASAWTRRSFCSGTVRANTDTAGMMARNSSSLISSSSGPVTNDPSLSSPT